MGVRVGNCGSLSSGGRKVVGSYLWTVSSRGGAGLALLFAGCSGWRSHFGPPVPLGLVLPFSVTAYFLGGRGLWVFFQLAGCSLPLLCLQSFFCCFGLVLDAGVSPCDGGEVS